MEYSLPTIIFRGYVNFGGVEVFFPQMFEQISIRPNGGVMKL